MRFFLLRMRMMMLAIFPVHKIKYRIGLKQPLLTYSFMRTANTSHFARWMTEVAVESSNKRMP